MDITLKVGKRFTISGRVTDNKGKAMANVEVIAHKQPTRIYLGMGQNAAGSKTAQDGSHQLTLEEGKYDVTCGFVRGGESDIFLGKRLTDQSGNLDSLSARRTSGGDNPSSRKYELKEVDLS